MSAVPIKKVNDIIDLFGSPALKNLNNFSELGKVKANFKKAMFDIESIDPVQAYTGLGILYSYENNYKLAIESFKKAYEMSGCDLIESIHYANAEFGFGDQSIGISIYIDLIKNGYNEEEFLEETVLRFCAYLFIDELKIICENQNVAALIDLNSVLRTEIKEAYNILKFLEKNTISLNFYRKIRALPEYIFNLYHTTPTGIDIQRNIDFDRNELTFIYNLLSYPNTEFGNDLIYKINDELQLKLIEVYEEFKVSTLSAGDLITIFFAVEDQVVGAA